MGRASRVKKVSVHWGGRGLDSNTLDFPPSVHGTFGMFGTVSLFVYLFADGFCVYVNFIHWALGIRTLS